MGNECKPLGSGGEADGAEFDDGCLEVDGECPGADVGFGRAVVDGGGEGVDGFDGGPAVD